MGLDRSKFGFTTQLQVRNYEVDWQGVVHNAVYFQYFEVGRVAYLRELGVRIDAVSIMRESMIVVARNEIDYVSPARFGEVIEVSTRISFVKNSSFGFEGILEEPATRRRIAENVSIQVWLDHHTGRPKSVEDWFRKEVESREGVNARIFWPK